MPNPAIPAADHARAAASPPPRQWPDIRVVAGILVTLSIGSLLWNLFGPEPRIAVSPRTTFITAPVAADGLPDYAAHLTALLGPAPPPEENAAVLVLEALWPLEMKPGSRELAAVCRALGAAGPPRDPPLVDLENDPLVKAAVDDTKVVTEKPWRGDDLEAVSAWVTRNSPALDRLVAASRRPRYWFASPTLLESARPMLFSLLLPDIQSFRRAARSLACRGMWHLGAGRTTEAWTDILAIHRLSRLLGSQEHRHATFLVTHLVAIAVADVADTATRHLLAEPGLSAAERAVIRRDLEALAPLGDVTTPIGIERLAGIDAAVFCGTNRGGTGRRAVLSSPLYGITAGTPANPFGPFVFATSLDWNTVLTKLNESYDSLDAAAALPTAALRTAEFKRLEAHRAPSVGATVSRIVGTGLMLLVNREARSIEAATTLEAVLMPALSAYSDRVARAEAAFRTLLETAGDPP